jgi:RND family efflux transporter MFP subunit
MRNMVQIFSNGGEFFKRATTVGFFPDEPCFSRANYCGCKQRVFTDHGLTATAKTGLLSMDTFMSSSKPPLEGLRIERRAEQQPQSKMWLAVAVTALVVTGAAIWWHSGSDAVEVRTAVARDATGGDGERTVLNASGYVTARREATVSSKVTGKVTEVLIEEGMKVKADQIVARLDDSNVKAGLEVANAQLASAKAALAETEAQLKDADQEFQRTTELAKQHIASQSDLDLAESNAKSLQAHLAQQKLDVVVAERQVAMWQQQMDDMIIRAPFDGVITTKDAQPGEMISPVSAGGGFTRTGIGTIVDMSSLEIEIDVNESYINRVEPGQPVVATLDAYPDWKIPCKVIAIIPTADREKSTVKVRVGFDQLDPRILPDMSVKVAFRDNGGMAAGHAVIVPKNSVLNRDGRDVVFVVLDRHAERRAVTVTDTQGDDSVLSAGVSAGEKVIVDAPADLKDGMAVKEKKP